MRYWYFFSTYSIRRMAEPPRKPLRQMMVKAAQCDLRAMDQKSLNVTKKLLLYSRPLLQERKQFITTDVEQQSAT